MVQLVRRYTRLKILFVVALATLPFSSQEVLGQWSQQGRKLVGSGAAGLARQGISVALSSNGNTAIVGGPQDNDGVGAAWVFTRSATGVWSQQGPKLVGTGITGLAQFGTSVALSSNGSTAIVGAPSDNRAAGAAFIFTRSATGVWTQQGPKLVGTGATDFAGQGTSVALSSDDGSTAIVGGPGDNDGVGAAWVYTRAASGVWTQNGPKLVGTGAAGPFRRQGTSVSLSNLGNTAIVGGPAADDQAGAAWVFTPGAAGWTQQGPKLVGTGAAGRANQGSSVSLSSDGNIAIVGGPGDNGGAGVTWAFKRNISIWNQQPGKLVASVIDHDGNF